MHSFFFFWSGDGGGGGAVCSSSSFISTVGFLLPLDLFKVLCQALLVFFFFLIQGILGLCGLTVIWKLSALACSAIWVS